MMTLFILKFIPNRLANNHLKQTPKINQMAAAFFNLDPQFVAKLNAWADETHQLNEGWFRCKAALVDFYSSEFTHTLDHRLSLDLDELVSLPDIFNISIFRNELRELNLSFNHLRTLPASIGNLQSLYLLDLSNNRTLSGLPQEILNLPPTCTIDLSGCNLSQSVLTRLREATTAPEYAGPRISYSMSTRRNRATFTTSLEQSLSHFYALSGIAPKDLSGLSRTDTLHRWLCKLSETADYKGNSQKAFAVKIIHFLEKANEDVAFREIFDATILDAVDTCGDRVTLSILKLSITHKLITIDLRNIQGLNHLLTRGVWALDLLHEIARQKIRTLRFVDEIEVYLGYPIKLKETLDIPIDVEEMLYFKCSCLTPTDLEIAKDTVLSTIANEEEHSNFLLEQPQWLKALKLNYQERFTVIKKNKEHASNTDDPDFVNIDNTFKQDLKDLTKYALRS